MGEYWKKCKGGAKLHTASSIMMLISLIIAIVAIVKAGIATFKTVEDEDVKLMVFGEDSKAYFISAIVLFGLGFIGYMTSVVWLIRKKCYKMLMGQTVLNMFGIPA